MASMTDRLIHMKPTRPIRIVELEQYMLLLTEWLYRYGLGDGSPHPYGAYADHRSMILVL